MKVSLMTDQSHSAESLQRQNKDIKLNNMGNKKRILITELTFKSAIGLEMQILETFRTPMAESHPSRNKN